MELRERTGEDKVCLFMDQLSAHTSEKAKATMRELGFRWVYNVAYSPQWNPIELVFSKVKHTFKVLRAQKLTGLRQEGHEALIHMAVGAVTKQEVVNCV